MPSPAQPAQPAVPALLAVSAVSAVPALLGAPPAAAGAALTSSTAGVRMGSRPSVVAIAGPTASGKSAVALALAQAIGAEIISVDSALVYSGMDIGTAKPSAAERAAVPHHLIDIREPQQPYSAAEFAADAQQAVAAIHARGRHALLVGGTLLYFKALFEGLDPLPPANAAVRAELEAQAQAQGWAALHAQLAQVDPDTARRLAPADAQRIQRALEVYRITGQPLSHWHSRSRVEAVDRLTGPNAATFADTSAAGSAGGAAWMDAAAAGRGRAASSGLQPAAFFSLEPRSRAWLHARIAQRFDAMLQAGFLDEVKALRARGDLHPDLPSMRCVGYRQAWQALDEGWPLAQLRERGIAATRQLAKRQLTWLRSQQGLQRVACDEEDALAVVQAGLNSPDAID